MKSEFKLYEIAESIAWSIDNIQDEETKEGTLELLEDELKHKSVSLIHVNNEFKRKNDTIQAEIDRLKELQASNKKDWDKFTEYVGYCLKKTGEKKIVTDLGSIVASKSLVTEVDTSKLPKKYFITKIIPEKKEVKPMGKPELKKLVQAGETIEGVALVEKLNVKFK